MKKLLVSVSIQVVVILFITAALAGEKPSVGPYKVGKKDLCPVCGMFVHKYPNWIGQIVFNDKTFAFFDGPKDMFKYYFDLKKYNPKKKMGDIEGIWVTDYYTIRPIDAKTAFYVVGSDLLGPMGRELIPHINAKAAENFLKDLLK